MNFSEYQGLAERTVNVDSPYKDQLGNYAMGAAGESGELVDVVKKHLYQGHDLDRDHIVKEIGDTLWYLANMATLLGYDLEYCAERNIEKLEKRYPNGFSERASIERLDAK